MDIPLTRKLAWAWERVTGQGPIYSRVFSSFHSSNGGVARYSKAWLKAVSVGPKKGRAAPVYALFLCNQGYVHGGDYAPHYNERQIGGTFTKREALQAIADQEAKWLHGTPRAGAPEVWAEAPRHLFGEQPFTAAYPFPAGFIKPAA